MKECFIIMPISTPKHLLPMYRGDQDHFPHVLEHLFIPAVKKAGMEPVPPKVKGSEVIQAEIIKNIEQCHSVLCDMSALNPNVFFELGVRTAADKQVCMVVDDVTEPVPFDISIVNYHKYSSCLDPWILQAEIETLSEHLTAVEQSGEQNPLWRYFGLSARAEFSAKETGLEGKVDLLGLRLEGIARQLDQYTKGKESEEPEDDKFEAFKILKTIAARDGVTIRRGKPSEKGIVMYIDPADLPEATERTMRDLAAQMGYELDFEKPQGK